MNSKWTEQQTRAIEESGGNILVSAAAGSGKTAVLIERILKIIEAKTDIDKLLIVTFTTAAAAEIRERLYNALQKKLDQEGNTQAQANRLCRQQTLLSKAYITTIHAFCQSVIKSNSVESGIDSSFRVADPGEIAMTRAEVMEDVIETWYAKEDPRFYRLIELFGTYRSDKGLMEQIFGLYDFAQSSPDPLQWLSAQKEAFDTSRIRDFTETKWCMDIVQDLYLTAVSFLENFEKLRETSRRYGIAEYEEMLRKDKLAAEQTVRFLAESRKPEAHVKWADIFSAVCSMRFEKAPVMSAKRKAAYDEKTQEIIAEVKEERGKLMKKIQGTFLAKIGASPDAPLADLRLLKEDMECLIDVTLQFATAYQTYKYERQMLDFDDLEHIAFQTLSHKDGSGNYEKSGVARRYSEYFEEVYVDEYQDTNELQDAILSLVSRDSAESVPNRFLVGDVKQSIYGFRQARPDLFLEKYKAYGEQGGTGCLIQLNRNFRSRSAVLHAVNGVFSKLMTENTCGLSYGEDEALHFGASYYPTGLDAPVELHVVQKAGGAGGMNYEAQIVARRVQELLAEKFQVYDKAANGMRDLQYRDIVILMRAPSSGHAGEEYARCLQDIGIPAYYGEEGGFFSNTEVNILLSFLKVIDNPLQDIPVVSVMRNIYGFPDRDIALVKADSLARNAEGESFYEMCRQYGKQDALQEKLQQFTARLERLREMSLHRSVSELLWILMQENHFYEHLKEGPFGELHMANLNLLYNRAILYDQNTNKGLFRFLYYFDSLKKRNGDFSAASAVTEGMNVVRIMSIHKSKGLEFPVVILSETGRNFNKRDMSSPLLKHRLLGLGPTCYDAAQKVKYPSVMKFCVARRIESDNKAEEMRVLYVAMTRASEKLILTGSSKIEFDKYAESCQNKCSSVTGNPLEYHILEAKCFLDWLMMCGAAERQHTFCHIEPEPAEDGGTQQETELPAAFFRNSLPIPPPEMTFYQEEYEKKPDVLPAKISVSDLKRRMDLQEDAEYAGMRHSAVNALSDLPVFAYEDADDLSAAEKGTAVHTCLQSVDYRRIAGITESAAAEYVDALLLHLEDAGFLSRKAAASVSRGMLRQYVASPFAQRIAKADEIQKEIPFTLLKELHGVLTAVQGIIDCVIREGERYTVIDFKTDEVPHAEKYRAQLACYAESIQNACGSRPDQIVYFIKQNKEVRL